MAAPTDLTFFGLEAAEPWCYIPDSWIRTGTVFLNGDEQFYRLLRPEAGGWWCESVPAGEVGPAAKVGHVRARLTEYQLAAQAAAGAADDSERASAQAHAEYLRDELVRLCNERPWFDVDQASARGLAFVAVSAMTALAALLVMVYHRPRWVMDGTDTRVPWVRTVLIIGGIAVLLLALAAVHILTPIGTRWRLPGSRPRR